MSKSPLSPEQLHDYLNKIIARARRDGVNIGIIMASVDTTMAALHNTYWIARHGGIADELAVCMWLALGPEPVDIADALARTEDKAYAETLEMVDVLDEYDARREAADAAKAYIRELARRDACKPREVL